MKGREEEREEGRKEDIYIKRDYAFGSKNSLLIPRSQRCSCI
jgi:hypothetical protein